MGACISTSAELDDVTRKEPSKNSRTRSFSSSSESGFSGTVSNSTSSSDTSCKSSLDSSSSLSIVRQALAPPEADFKKPAKKHPSSALFRALTGKEQGPRPLVRRKVRRSHSFTLVELPVLDSCGGSIEVKLTSGRRRRSVNDIPPEVKQEILNFLTAGEEIQVVKKERESANKDNIGIISESDMLQERKKEKEETGTSESMGLFADKKDVLAVGSDGPRAKNGENSHCLDMENAVDCVDWQYPLVEDKSVCNESCAVSTSMEKVPGGASSMQEKICRGVEEKHVSQETCAGWPLQAAQKVKSKEETEANVDEVPETEVCLDDSTSNHSSGADVHQKAPVHTLEAMQLPVSEEEKRERSQASEMKENLILEVGVFLGSVRNSSNGRLCKESFAGEKPQGELTKVPPAPEETDKAMLSPSALSPTSSRKFSPVKPASPKPPKPKVSLSFSTNHRKSGSMDKEPAKINFSASVEEENDLEMDDEVEVAEFDPALLAVFEEAFQQYSEEDWMSSSRSVCPRRRSIEVWAQAVAKAASLKEQNASKEKVMKANEVTEEGGEEKGMQQMSESSEGTVTPLSGSPTSVLTSSVNFSNGSSWDGKESPVKVVSRDVWASEDVPGHSDRKGTSKRERYFPNKKNLEKEFCLASMSETDFTAAFDRFLDVRTSSTDLSFLGLSSKSSTA